MWLNIILSQLYVSCHRAWKITTVRVRYVLLYNFIDKFCLLVWSFMKMTVHSFLASMLMRFFKYNLTVFSIQLEKIAISFLIYYFCQISWIDHKCLWKVQMTREACNWIMRLYILWNSNIIWTYVTSLLWSKITWYSFLNLKNAQYFRFKILFIAFGWVKW